MGYKGIVEVLLKSEASEILLRYTNLTLPDAETAKNLKPIAIGLLTRREKSLNAFQRRAKWQRDQDEKNVRHFEQSGSGKGRTIARSEVHEILPSFLLER